MGGAPLAEVLTLLPDSEEDATRIGNRPDQEEDVPSDNLQGVLLIDAILFANRSSPFLDGARF